MLQSFCNCLSDSVTGANTPELNVCLLLSRPAPSPSTECCSFLRSLLPNCPGCMQEAQAALLGKDDDLAVLRREMQALRAQLKKTPDSAACRSTTHNSAPEANGQPSSSLLKPHPDADKPRKGASAGAAESGLPSPSLPATPHSPVDSPRGATLPPSGSLLPPSCPPSHA